MRISRDLLLNSAREFTARAVKVDRSIAAAYLTGSLLTEDPLLGGTTDIDLVFVHDNIPPHPREIHRFTDEISLDLYHHDQSKYDQPRALRSDPILGPSINATRVILHDTLHWFEYTQAIITAQFDRPDHHAERVNKLIADARADWWRLEGKDTPNAKDMAIFINSAERAANALASITGLPLAERRFMLTLPERCQAVDSPQLSLGYSSLLGLSTFDFSTLEEWIHRWEPAMYSLDNPTNLPPEVHPHRKLYYLNALRSFFEEGQLESCLWILIRSWTRLAASLPSRTASLKEYLAFTAALGFNKSNFTEKITTLDQYLDTIEERITRWTVEIGA
jgi:hypothetical protein